MALSVGVVGYRGHAERLIRIVDASPIAQVRKIYHRKKSINDVRGTGEFRDLLELDAIIISSPNHTHFNFLKTLKKARYAGYIFCEKPPVTSKNELDKLALLNLYKGKVRFNFNYRFSKLFESIEMATEQGMLGDPITIDVISSHGLAYTGGYQNSWRADIDLHRHGIIETKAIHWLDMFECLYGPSEAQVASNLNVSGLGSSFDTSKLVISYGKQAKANITASYAAPLMNSLTILGTNGCFYYKDGLISIHSPRDTFDNKGRFAVPSEVYRYDFATHDAMCQDSIQKSLAGFLSVCESNHSFPTEVYDQSIRSTALLMELDA